MLWQEKQSHIIDFRGSLKTTPFCLGGAILFYDISKVLTYNAYFNFLIGERGVGKTYSSKNFVIRKFLKRQEQFIYLRRYKTEIDKAKRTYFNDIAVKYPDKDLYCKGDTFYIDDKPCGFAVPLSTTNILKSVCYDNVTTIIFDEFIIDKGCYHYLQGEVKTFLEFCETVFRLRDNVRVLFLANAITQTNPYFLYFDLELPKDKNIKLFKNGLILLEIMKNEEYRQQKMKSKFGQLVNGTEYGDYAIKNEFLRDNDKFIQRKTGQCNFAFAFIWQGSTFGVWYNMDLCKMFVSEDYIKNATLTFTTTLENHKPNTMLLKSVRNFACWQMFLKKFKLGNVYFESIKIKNVTYELIKSILI